MIQVTRKMIQDQPQLQMLRRAIDEQVKRTLVVAPGVQNFYEESKNNDLAFDTPEGPLYVRFDYAAYGPSPDNPHINVSNIVIFDSKEEKDSL